MIFFKKVMKLEKLTKVKPSAKFTLLLLSMLTIMSNVAIVTVLPHLSEIFKDVPNIELYSRLMITLPSLAIALLAPFLGYAVHRFGKRRSAIFSLLAFTLFGTAGFYLQSIYEILVSRFLFGVAIALLMIISTSLVGDYFKSEERHRFMGAQSAFVSIGGIVFIVGGGLLSDINWRYPFAIYLLGVVVLGFVLRYLVEFERDSSLDDASADVNAKFFYVYVLAFLFMTFFYILPTQMPFLIINHFHSSGAFAGEIIATAFVFNALGAISFAKLKKRLSFSSLYLLGTSVMGGGFFLIGFVENVNLFFITSPIMGFGGGMMMTTITAWTLSKAHHSKRVKSSAYLTSSLFFGQFVSPLVFHPFVDYLGIQKFFIVTGAFIFLGTMPFVIRNHWSKRQL